MTLAQYAVKETEGFGRFYPTQTPFDRNEFQRDYTRILHSESFRKLQYKTQVFSNDSGDFFRTRLTHSLEVEQLARSTARYLGLNEDLSAVLAIGHDLGHAPFGHLGQDILDELMQDYGGFEHNWQVIRLVTLLESPYPNHQGLNLMFETLEGLLKHCKEGLAEQLGPIANRHIIKKRSSLEAQVVDWSDAIAYVHADLEDAFIMNVLSMDHLKEAPGFMEAYLRLSKLNPNLRLPDENDFSVKDRTQWKASEAVVLEVLREMRRYAQWDLLQSSQERIKQINPKDSNHAREFNLIGFSDEHLVRHKALKVFSRKYIYNHEEVTSVRDHQAEVIRGLFYAYTQDPSEMSGKGVDPSENFYRAVADHISGMTDRYALTEYDRLLSQSPHLLREPKVKSMKAK